MAKAIAFTAKHEASWIDTQDLQAPGATQIAGRTLYSLISPGTELASGYIAESGHPHLTGYAAAFEVTAVGTDVEGFQVGDIAFCMGHHRSDQCVEAKMTVKAPANLSAEMVPLARLMGVGMTTLKTSAARPGDHVLVTGAGPVGLLTAISFQLSGYHVTIVDPVALRRKQAEQAGIRQMLEHIPVEDPSFVGRFALVAECSGHEAALIAGCQVVRPRGEVVMVGVPWVKRTELSAHELAHAVFHRYVVLRSGWEWELPIHAGHFQPHSIMGNLGQALNWLSEEKVQVNHTMRIVKPDQANAAYDGLHQKTNDALFVLFDWS